MQAHRTQGAVAITVGVGPDDVPSLRLTKDAAVLRPRPGVRVEVMLRGAATAHTLIERVETEDRKSVSVTTWLAPGSAATLGILAELVNVVTLPADVVVELFLGTRGIPRAFRELVRFAFALP